MAQNEKIIAQQEEQTRLHYYVCGAFCSSILGIITQKGSLANAILAG